MMENTFRNGALRWKRLFSKTGFDEARIRFLTSVLNRGFLIQGFSRKTPILARLSKIVQKWSLSKHRCEKLCSSLVLKKITIGCRLGRFLKNLFKKRLIPPLLRKQLFKNNFDFRT
jgi:hypothetical protein